METLKQPVFEATKEDAKNAQVTGILMVLESIFNELSGEISGSLKLLDLGKETEFTKKLKDSIDSPWNNYYKAVKSISKSVNSYKEKLISVFLIGKRENLSFAYFAHDLECTHVFVGLLSDTLDNRDDIYEFIDIYEGREISSVSPIVLHFTDKETIDGISNLIKIDLNESTH